MRARKLPDDETFRELWLDGVSVSDICERFGVSRGAVYKLVSRLGLPGRRNGAPQAATEGAVSAAPPRPVPAAAPKAPCWDDDRDAQVLATGGRYSKIEKLAKRWGIPTTRIVARWHLVRAT